MVLERKETTVAYRCPHCGALVTSMVGAFSLSADMLKLKCPCGESELQIVYTRDRKIRLTVPCFTCPNPHIYTVSSQVFFSGELFRIPCALSGLDICFAGKKNDVMAAVEQSDEELRELLGDAGIDELLRSRGEEFLSDPQVLEIITYVVQDLCEEGKVHCRCEEGCGDFLIEIGDVSVTVTCKKCGAMAVIPADSLSRAQDFLGAESLELS